MSKKPSLKKTYAVIPHSPDRVELKEGVWNGRAHVVNDQSKKGSLSQLVSFLDGSMTVSDIAKKLGVSHSQVEAVLDRLMQLGAIEFQKSSAMDAFLEKAGGVLNRYTLSDRVTLPVVLCGDESITKKICHSITGYLPSDSIQVLDSRDPRFVSFGSLSNQSPQSLLDFERLASNYQDWKGRLIVFSQSVINPVASSYLNKLAHAVGMAILHVSLDGPYLFVGPLTEGGSGPCYACYEARVLYNLKEKSQYVNYKQSISNYQVLFKKNILEEPFIDLAAAHASIEVINYSLTQNSFVKNRPLSIFLPTMEVKYHDVFQMSGCPVCGSVSKRDDEQLYFDNETLLRGAACNAR